MQNTIGGVPELPAHIKAGLSPAKAVPIPITRRVNGRWSFPERMGGKDKIGFVYIIRDNYMRKFYLGKKFFWTGEKSYKVRETDWKTYMSSSKLLVELMKNRPQEEFDFICLEQYKKRSSVSYAESWSLFHVESAFKDEWLNKRIEAITCNV